MSGQVCNSVFGEVDFYDHAKTEEWNSTIIVSASNSNCNGRTVSKKADITNPTYRTPC